VPEEVLAYLNVLVWPAIVVVALIVFRVPIGGILANLEEFEGFGIKAKVHRRVTQAAENSNSALMRSPIGRYRGPGLSIVLFVTARNMQKALEFSSSLMNESAPPGGQLQQMRRVVERLETAIVAVLVATAFPASDETSQIQVNMTPGSVDAYLFTLTGYTGWRGVVEARDILRRTLNTICGKSASSLESDDVRLFVLAGGRAFEQLEQLVNAVVNDVDVRRA
jgi:hypothetical protein